MVHHVFVFLGGQIQVGVSTGHYGSIENKAKNVPTSHVLHKINIQKKKKTCREVFVQNIHDGSGGSKSIDVSFNSCW